jgi:hypothetical protein
MADEQQFARVPRCVVQEVLADGTSPLHLRLQLSRCLSQRSCEKGNADAALGVQDVTVEAALLEARCTTAVASFLPHEDILRLRAASTEMLFDVMQPQLSVACSAGSDTDESCDVSLTEVHDRIRARLWLQRLGTVTQGSADESVFETRVRSFVDVAMRRRLESEVAAAKALMEDEVREAKASMLQCVQVVSEEVDRRVRDNVLSLQVEFERRTADQAKSLHEMVERRVTEQTQLLQAEVDRRTDGVRVAMDRCARDQQEAASQLRAEVALTRAMLEERVWEQEKSAEQFGLELETLRAQMVELTAIRQALEERVADQEETAAQLRGEIAVLTGRVGKRFQGRALAMCWAPLVACLQPCSAAMRDQRMSRY